MEKGNVTSLCLYQKFYDLSVKRLFFLTSLIHIMPEGNFPPWPWHIFYWGSHCWEKSSPLCSVGSGLRWGSGCYCCRGLVICPGWYAKKQFPFMKLKGSWNILPFKMWNTVDQLIGDIIFVRNRFSSHEDLKFSRMWEHYIFQRTSQLLCTPLLLFEAIQNLNYVFSSAPML